jgi:hypothetical protein
MVRVNYKPFRLICPDFADILVGFEAAQGLEASTKVVCANEVVEVGRQLGMAVIMIAFYRCLLDRPVHPFDLAVGPEMLDFREPLLDLVFVTDPIEDEALGDPHHEYHDEALDTLGDDHDPNAKPDIPLIEARLEALAKKWAPRTRRKA